MTRLVHRCSFCECAVVHKRRDLISTGVDAIFYIKMDDVLRHGKARQNHDARLCPGVQVDLCSTNNVKPPSSFDCALSAQPCKIVPHIA